MPAGSTLCCHAVFNISQQLSMLTANHSKQPNTTAPLTRAVHTSQCTLVVSYHSISTTYNSHLTTFNHSPHTAYPSLFTAACLILDCRPAPCRLPRPSHLCRPSKVMMAVVITTLHHPHNTVRQHHNITSQSLSIRKRSTRPMTTLHHTRHIVVVVRSRRVRVVRR